MCKILRYGLLLSSSCRRTALGCENVPGRQIRKWQKVAEQRTVLLGSEVQGCWPNAPEGVTSSRGQISPHHSAMRFFRLFGGNMLCPLFIFYFSFSLFSLDLDLEIIIIFMLYIYI
jgi:hypothetical protein